MKDKMNIPDYDFKANNSGGALERIIHDQKNPPHMLQSLSTNKKQLPQEEDVDSLLVLTNEDIMTHHTNGTFKETKREVK